MMKRLAILTVVALHGIGLSYAQKAPSHAHKPGMQHGVSKDVELPQETGQAAFAAIQEIVAKLEADPRTDWSKVNIEALRQHLIDMNEVTLGATVAVETQGGGRTFVVTGDGDVVGSIQRMVMGHATTMSGKNGWTMIAKATSKGATVFVKPPGPELLTKLDSLGFIGLMTMGMHHQEHHWMIATGYAPHN